jgi:RND superfamily putative drug exporter
VSRFLTVPAGRRAKFVVVAVCLLALFASGAANRPGKYSDAENNESTSFLPGDAESTKVLGISEELQGGEQAPIVVVYRREGGLSGEDQARIAADREELNAAIEQNAGDVYRAVSPFAEPRPSEASDAALLVGNVTGDGEGDTILDPIDDIRDRVSDPGGGLEVKVTGPAGFAADAINVFENINGTLLFSALLLVVFLLIMIYRSPIFLWIPLFAVVFAEVATRSIGYGPDKHEAMALALRTAGPAIVASGATVICALLCLTIAGRRRSSTTCASRPLATRA